MYFGHYILSRLVYPRTTMRFTQDNDLALRAAVSLINTRDGEGERLHTPDDLDRFLDEYGFTGIREHTERELDQVRRWRERLREIWGMDEEALVASINHILKEVTAVPQLLRHDGFDWHFHATPLTAPLADRLATEAAMALADVARAGELSRLKFCEADDCTWAFFDFSKNRARRFCDAGGCANRTHVAAFRARKANEAR